MSTSYYLYGAQDVNGKLICINPSFSIDGENRIAATYKNWSRSYFGETANKLEVLGMQISFDELPEEIKAQFRFGSSSDTKLPVYEISLDALENCIPKGQRHEHHGIYSKDRVFAFESGEIEDLFEDDISPEKYVILDEKYRQKYVYYEWDDPMGWFVHVKEILEHLKWQISDWESVHFFNEDNNKYFLLLIIV